jgi:DNA-binding CsgD family transcriptional regulator
VDRSDQTPEAILRQTIALLKAQGLKPHTLLELYEDAISIPATIFATDLTPFETASEYLRSQRSKTPKAISELLNRSTSSVNNALANCKRKHITVEDDASTPYRIPVTAFHNTALTPAEAIILCLHTQYQLPNATISKLLGRDPRNTWKLCKQAQKKVRA